MSKQKGFILKIILLVMVNYLPTFYLINSGVKTAFFFPNYFIASTIYTIIAVLLVMKIRTNLHPLLLIIIMVIKSIIVQAVLLYIFTPTFDLIFLKNNIDKFCSPLDKEILFSDRMAAINKWCADRYLERF